MSRIKILIPDEGPQHWELTPQQRRLRDKREKELIYTLKQTEKCQ